MTSGLAAFAVGPGRCDPGRMALSYGERVCEVFAYAPPADPEPGHHWRGYAIYPEDVLHALADDRHRRFLAEQLAPLGIEVG